MQFFQLRLFSCLRHDDLSASLSPAMDLSIIRICFTHSSTFLWLMQLSPCRPVHTFWPQIWIAGRCSYLICILSVVQLVSTLLENLGIMFFPETFATIYQTVRRLIPEGFRLHVIVQALLKTMKTNMVARWRKAPVIYSLCSFHCWWRRIWVNYFT